MTDRPFALIVEDDPESRMLAERVLAKTGFSCASAVDGEDALAQIAARRPSLVLLDLSMPKVDGWEVARRVRQDPTLDGVRILAMTAHVMPGDRERALAAGCDEYLSKPYLPNELFSAVARVLGLSGSTAVRAGIR